MENYTEWINQEREPMLLNNVESDLKTRFEKKGITQKELAVRMGIPSVCKPHH